MRVLEQPNGQEPGFYEVQDELRLIRAENEKRDRELALMRAELVVFRSQLDVSRTHLETIVSVLGPTPTSCTKSTIACWHCNASAPRASHDTVQGGPMEHRGTPPKDRPAPTPVNRLGSFFKRQHKYHPARPYRWWESKQAQGAPCARRSFV
ncbi:MAG: hypothetical protein ACREYC_28000 [Gammaproteobacteria bacterium]